MIKALAHLCFLVKDLDRAVAFYRDRLGFREAFDFRNDRGERYGIYLHVDGRSFIELFKGEPQLAQGKPSYQHLCLEVDDMQAAVAELRRAGVEVGDISLGSDHSYQAWIADPEGNRIELMQYTPQSKQNVVLR